MLDLTALIDRRIKAALGKDIGEKIYFLCTNSAAGMSLNLHSADRANWSMSNNGCFGFPRAVVNNSRDQKGSDGKNNEGQKSQ